MIEGAAAPLHRPPRSSANYVDTHGAVVVGFAFTELLGFRLLPRLKNIGAHPALPPRRRQPAPGRAGAGADAADPAGS